MDNMFVTALLAGAGLYAGAQGAHALVKLCSPANVALAYRACKQWIRLHKRRIAVVLALLTVCFAGGAYLKHEHDERQFAEYMVEWHANEQRKEQKERDDRITRDAINAMPK
jgi:hypothetical protein